MSKGNPDHFYRKAKEQGFPARSVFKLSELDQKYNLFRKRYKVLDLGASPGSWLVYITKQVEESGFVLGIDLNSVAQTLSSNCRVIQMDIFNVQGSDLKKQFGIFDVVVSDLAPKTTGNREADHARSYELCRHAFALAQEVLKPGGSFVCKMYQGEESKSFLEGLLQYFGMCKTQKPKASRSTSREIFFVGRGFIP